MLKCMPFKLVAVACRPAHIWFLEITFVYVCVLACVRVCVCVSKLIRAKFYPVKRKSKFICAIILEYVNVDFKVLQLYAFDCSRPRIA